MSVIIFYKILFVIGAYLLGAFPTAYIIYKLKKGGDIRREGSGNVGGTNITRTIGPVAGIGTIIADMLKGFIPVLILYFIFPDDLILLAAVTVVAVIGHDYPVYLKFKGGKGISTSFGVMVGLCSLPFAGFENAIWLRILPPFLILFTWLIVFLASRIVSLSSLAAAISTPLSFYFARYPLPIVIAAICLSILTFIAHRDNIKRLIKGEEKKIKRKGA
ncbi:MAG: glycerol-3-phosphate 1-O-acyltransferase PlsY [Actinobacteria bacterium]|nr:glycerol-3-phosphate 1-O-acyltransferase PlsY [Actinomycetota bacterium]